ncbi:hypothetical protein V6N13_050905 [Hibiscus sabdariffa]
MGKHQPFVKERSLDQRQEESKTILTKYPDRIPLGIVLFGCCCAEKRPLKSSTLSGFVPGYEESLRAQSSS